MKRIFTYISLLLFFTSAVFAQIPTGYYNTATGLSGESLRSALKTITTTGHVKLSYADVWIAYAHTDVKPSPDTTIIWDMYTDIPGGISSTTLTLSTGQCGNGGSAEGFCYSREHCLPNSWWGGLGKLTSSTYPQYTDLHHLFPADQYVNGYKSNYPIGQVGTPTYTSNNGSKLGPCSYPGYNGVVFEPINEYKGDFARAYLYMATRYMDSLSAWVNNFSYPTSAAVINSSGNNFKQWFIDMMLAWHNADPVSSKETNRNNAIYYNTLQHNRNPFVDHPEYVQAIWGGSAVIKPEPSNHVSNFLATNSSPLNSSITVNWTDAVGTVQPDGYLIRASTSGFSQMLPPTDSIPESITTLQKTVSQGAQNAIFTGLTPGTLYYFKIYPFTNSGSNINYKTSLTIPTASVATSAYVWKEDFETGSKTSYATATVSCSMGSWTLNDALIGTSDSDRKNGLKSVRLKAGNLNMNFDKTDGADTVVIYHAKFGTDANAIWKLQLSTDGGFTWGDVGNPVTSSDTVLTPAVFSVKHAGNVRFNIVSLSPSSSTIRANIDDISITNYTAPMLSPPIMNLDVTNNDVDNNIDIGFSDNSTWRSAITAVKIGGSTLTTPTDYIISAANIQLKPSGGNALLTTSGTKTITIEAYGYINDSVIQIINAGAPTSNSTAFINSALALNSSRIITCTAKDQFNNSVAGYSFKMDVSITNNNTLTSESYAIDGSSRNSSISNLNLVATTNASGTASFSAGIPLTVDPGDGLIIQMQLSDGTTNIGNAFQFSGLYPQTISFGALPTVSYGSANFNLTATASSGLTINYQSSNIAVATISGTTVSIVGIGTTSITASQGGNATYYPANNIIQALLVSTKTLTITAAQATDKVYNGTNAAVITGSLSGIDGTDVVSFNGIGSFAAINAGNAIVVSSNCTLSGVDATKYTLTQPVGLTANITKAPQTISFGALATKTINDADYSPGALSATSGINTITYTSSNTAVATIVSNQIHIIGTGTTTITALESGNGNYTAAPNVSQLLTVSGYIAAWDFTGYNSGPDTVAATNFNSNLISTSGASNITRGAGASASSANNSFRTLGFKNEGISTSNTDYFQITLTAANGYKLSLSTIDAKFGGTSTFYASPGVSSQFAYSLNGTTFTLIASPVQSTSLSMAQINLSGISALQNVAPGTTITLRYYASGQTSTGGWGFFSTASGSNGLAIGGTVNQIIPTLSVGAISAFGNQCTNTTTGPNSFVNTGTDLTSANITVGALTGYTFATTSGGNYTNTLTISQAGGSFSQTIFVKFSPSEAISYDGDIVVSGGGGTPVMRSVSGSGIHTVAGTLTPTASSILGGQNAELTLTANTGTITKWQKSANAGSLWTDILSSANPFSETPISLGSMDYRAIVQNGICPEASSNQVSIVVNPNTTSFTAANNNDWNKTINWNNGIPNKLFNVMIPANNLAVIDSNNNECNNLTILGQLTINPLRNLSVNGSLSIQSDATGTGSIIESNGINATVQRYIPSPDQFHMLASPVTAQAISSIVSASDSLYLWSEPSETWTSYTANNFATINGGMNFQTGKAYAVSFPSVVTKSFSGALNHGIVNIPLSFTTGNFSGWNYIANPYPSAINWNSANGFKRSMLMDAGADEKAIWIWNPVNANYGSYVSNLAGLGTNGVSQYIAASQGFWVKSVIADTLKMNDSVRVHANQAWLKTTASSPEMLRIHVSGNGNTYSDEIIISYGKTSDQFGAEKMFSMEASAPGLYTTKFNKNWSINYLTTITEHPTVPIGFKPGVNGIYTLHFTENEQFNQLILEDIQTGIQKNMIPSSNYTFMAQTTDNADRFLLHFTSVSNNINEIQNPDILIFSNNSTIYINTQEKVNEIKVFTLLGQLIFKQTGNTNTISKIHLKNAAAYYLVKVITNKNVYTKKLFVN